MSYLKLTITVPDEYQEYLIAELMDLDFYGFEQRESEVIAYVELSRFNDSSRETIEQMIGAFPEASFSEFEEVKDENWNRKWEETIQPQKIGKFVVCPEWNIITPGKDETLLIVEPKMAFGTGYHETTRLMLRAIQDLNCSGKSILDAGTGTGILAIAALKLGAELAVGFDYDPLSVDNALDNGIKNNVDSKLDIRLGGTDQIGENEKFDITLANINRNVIIEFLADFSRITKSGGRLILSGLLAADEKKMQELMQNFPFKFIERKTEGEWIMLHFQKELK